MLTILQSATLEGISFWQIESMCNQFTIFNASHHLRGYLLDAGGWMSNWCNSKNGRTVIPGEMWLYSK